jgi:transcriptional regulator with XRE-family HTH domain
MEKSLHSTEYRLLLDMLREARENAGLTQEDLAGRLSATQSFVSKCERGERRLDIIELRYWCDAIGLSLPTFLKKFDQARRRN